MWLRSICRSDVGRRPLGRVLFVFIDRQDRGVWVPVGVSTWMVSD